MSAEKGSYLVSSIPSSSIDTTLHRCIMKIAFQPAYMKGIIENFNTPINRGAYYKYLA